MLNNPPVPFTPIDGAVQIRADVYPANVQFSWDPAVRQKARAIVTADRIYVLVDAQGPPGLLYEGRLEDVAGDRKTYQVTTEDGLINISRGGGCGCGSKLKAYKPYRRAVRMATV